MKKRKPRFFFSFRSPYSWMGYRELEKRMAPPQQGIEYIPFWEPDRTSLEMLKTAKKATFPYMPMSKEKHRYILQDIKRLSEKLGYPLKWPVDKDPWWEVPHLGYIAARQQGRAGAFMAETYRFRWEKGEDICAPETIRRICENIGLDPRAAMGAPEDPSIRGEGVEALYNCFRDEVFGVPFFVNGFQKFWGIDRLAWFIDSLNRAGPGHQPGKRSPKEGGAPPGCYDNDHPGGCG